MNVRAVKRRITCGLLGAILAIPNVLWAQNTINEDPNAAAMVGDLLVARPVGLVMTVGGTAAFLVSLPFTLLSGHASQAAETLMLGPAETTFMRCLGCRETGYTHIDIEQNKDDDDTD